MEWSDFSYSSLEESFYGLLSPQLEMDQYGSTSDWTPEENKLFENALAEFDPNSPAFFDNVASRIPWKSIQDIRVHYQALVEDVEMIESGKIPVPEYKSAAAEVLEREDDGKKEKGSPSSSSSQARSGMQRRRGVPWTEEEHQLFLMGLNKYGKGDWRSISRYYVITKTPTQVASHAQKYFRRQTSSTPMDKRRPSIHDIQTVSPATSMRHAGANTSLDQGMAAFSSRALIPPMLHYGFNGGGVVEQNPMFLPPAGSTFPSVDPASFNLQSAPGGYQLSASYLFPSMSNQQWG